MTKRTEGDGDILDELLVEKDEEYGPELITLEKIIHRKTGAVDKALNAKASVPGQSKKRKKQRKKKTTHYISQEVFTALGDAKALLKEQLSPEQRSSVSKSRIVDLALKNILEDLAAAGEESMLFKLIAKEKKTTDG